MHKERASSAAVQPVAAASIARDRLGEVAALALGLLGENISEPICIRDTDGEILYANALWHQLGAPPRDCVSTFAPPDQNSCNPDAAAMPDRCCASAACSHRWIRDAQGRALAELTVVHPHKQPADFAPHQVTGHLLQAIADNTQDAIYVKDCQGKYIFFNRAASQFVGKSLDEVLGHDDRDIFDSDGAQRIMQQDEEIVHSRQSLTRLETLTAGGITRTYHATKSPYIDDNGVVRGVIGIAREITEEVNAHRTLQEKTEFLKAVFQAMPECMKILDCEGRVVDMNAYGLSMIEAGQLSDVLGHCIFSLVVPEDRQRYIDFHNHVCAGHYEILEFACTSLTGKRLICESHAVPIEINNQRMHLSITRNVTDRKQTEKDLYYLWQNAIDPLCIASSNGYFLKVNPAWTKSLGWTEEELTSRPWLDFVHPDDQAATIEAGAKLLEGSPVTNFENRYRCKDGSYRWFSWSTIPLAGTPINYAFVRDVTDIKRLSEQFHQAQKLEAIGRLAGGVAHDFNNLLTVINGYSDMLLQEQPTKSPTAEALREIRSAGERAARLTMQLLTFSRKSMMERKAIDLNDLIAESVSLLRRLIGEDVCLSFTAAPRLGRVLADPGQIEQVLMNLVVNARDAMPTGGRLCITTESIEISSAEEICFANLAPGPYARLSVSDTGIGIASDVIDKIFEPFFTTKDSSKGTGLGLAVAHGVVSQCGGHISVTSTPGEGTTFFILLPTEHEQDRQASSETYEAKPDGPETILLVEDEEAVRKIASMGLESHGFRVLTAVDVEAALKLVQAYPGNIDLLITDIVMPGLGARELVEHVRGSRPGIKVLYISGYTDDAIVRHGIESANQNFLSKPFTPLTLAKKARTMLDG